MKMIIEAINTPSVWQFPPAAYVEARTYANQTFQTYHGQIIPRGNPNDPNSYYLSTPCEISGGNVLKIPSIEIDSTEDSPTNRTATYTTWIFIDGERAGTIPFLADFGVPYAGDPATGLDNGLTWGGLILHRDAPNPPPRQGVYDIGQVEYLIAAALGDLRRASTTQIGMAALTTDPINPLFPEVVGANDYASLSNIGIARLSAAPVSADDPVGVGKNDYATYENIGVTRLSFPPETASDPIAVGDNDSRIGYLTPQRFAPPGVPVGDGIQRALSTVYGTLAEAMADYQFITSLAQTVDYAAIQKMSYEALGYPTTGAAVAYTTPSTGSTPSVIVDLTAAYPVNSLVGRVLSLRYANGFEQQRVIASNTATTITLAAPLEFDWGTTICGYLALVPGSLYDCIAYGIIAQQEHGDSNAYMNKPMFIPAGKYKLGNSFWSIRNASGITLCGAGRRSTLIYGSNANTVLGFDGLWYSHFEGLDFEAEGAMTAVVDCDGNVPGHAYATRGVQANTWKDCKFNGNALTTYSFALTRLGNPGGGAQGSENLYLNCHFDGSVTANFYSTGFNALNNTFIGGNVATHQKHGIQIEGGSVYLFSVGFQSTYGYQQILNDGYDINANTTGVSDRITIIGCRSESLRFYRGASSQPPILIGNNNASYGADAGWFASTAGYYTLNKSIIKTSATLGPKLYVVTTPGTSGAVEPTWPDSGTVADGSVVWTQVEYYTVDLPSTAPVLISNAFHSAGNVRIGSWGTVQQITVNTAAALTIGRKGYTTPSQVIFCDTTTGNQIITVVINAHGPADGTQITIKKVTTDANTVTLAYSGGNGGEAVVLPGGSTGYVTIQYSASAGVTNKWWIVGRNP